jgi:septation ring formation regulator EzrA
LKTSLQSQIEDWQSQYNVKSPAALRTRAAETKTSEQTQGIRKIAADCELISYRLSIVEDAIENYDTYSKDFRVSA